MDVAAYLHRISYYGCVDPTADTLRALHRAHMFAVPFENLDILAHRAITLDDERIFQKIVGARRGGFCYELNGLFAALLRELGFSVTLLSARVADENGRLGPEFDHLALRVDMEQPWLADVGFGDSFVEPLLFYSSIEDAQGGFVYKLVRANDEWSLMRRDGAGAEWKLQYVFNLVPRQLSDFGAMCRYHQTSPESHFTKGRICSLATPAGRVTLAHMKLIETAHGSRSERIIVDECEYESVLRERFAVVVEGTKAKRQA